MIHGTLEQPLNERGLDIRCVRIKPYGSRDNLLLDVQQVIPLPEAQTYALTNQWGPRGEQAMRLLLDQFHTDRISFERIS